MNSMKKVHIEIEIPDGHEITSLFRGNAYGPYEDKSQAIPYTVHTRPAKMNKTKNFDLHGILALTTKHITNFKIEPFLINGVPVYFVSGLVIDKNIICHEHRIFAQDLGVACCKLLVTFAPLLDFDFDILYSGNLSTNVFQLNQNTVPKL